MTLLVRMLIEARERRQRLCQNSSSQLKPNYINNNSNELKKYPSGLMLVTTQGTNSIGNGASVTNNKTTQAERTTAMLTIIVAVFLITELPQGNNFVRSLVF